MIPFSPSLGNCTLNATQIESFEVFTVTIVTQALNPLSHKALSG